MRKAIHNILFLVLIVHATLVTAHRPGSFFNATTNGSSLTISTKTPNWFYQFAGMKIITRGVTITGPLTPSDNGFQLFSVSDTMPAVFAIVGSKGVLQLKLCLSGVGSTYGCETVDVASGSSPTGLPILTNFLSFSGGAGTALGNNFTPGLGSIGVNLGRVYAFQATPDLECNLNAPLGTSTASLTITSNTRLETAAALRAYLAPQVSCIAICNVSVTSPTYPGQSTKCTNPIPFIPPH